MSYSPFALLLKNKPKFKSGTMILQSEFRIFSKQPLRTNPTKEETISFNRSNPGKQLFSLQRWQLCKCVLNCNGHLIMTPNYANLFIHLLEQYFIYNSPTESKTWQRQEHHSEMITSSLRYQHSSSLWTGTIWGEPYLWEGLLFVSHFGISEGEQMWLWLQLRRWWSLLF